MEELVMLGTGNAAVTRCYNTCFTLNINGRHLLIDAGGGNGILRQLEEASIKLTDLEALMITHAHTDHLLGCVWIVRMIGQAMNQMKRQDDFHVYAHHEALHVLDFVCRQCLPPKLVQLLGTGIHFHCLKEDEHFEACGLRCQCFNTGSTKTLQYGLEVLLRDGQRLVCLGDEPLHTINEARCRQADWLLCEAFCLAAQADIFKPYEKNHSTALDAGRMAARLQVKNLLLYHTEDTQLANRKSLYTQEALSSFSGKVYVPDDLERIPLS